MTFDTLKNSAITRTELFMQQRAQSHRSRWRHPALYGGMVLLAAFSIGAGLEALSSNFVDDHLIRAVLLIFYLLLTLWHFRLMLRTLTLSSMAVTREKRDAERWESLLLTGVSGREIVFGKWWATMRTQWVEYLFLASLRAAAAVSISNIGQGLLQIYPSYIWYRSMHTTPLHVGLGILVVMIFTLASLPFTAACGVMSAMDTRRGSGLTRAFAARASFAILAALTPIILWLFFGGHLFLKPDMTNFGMYTEISNFFAIFSGVMLDNGLSFGGDLVANSYWIASHLLAGLGVVLLALSTYGVLTWMLLRIAQWRAERTGALYPREMKAIKSSVNRE